MTIKASVDVKTIAKACISKSDSYNFYNWLFMEHGKSTSER